MNSLPSVIAISVTDGLKSNVNRKSPIYKNLYN